jgi:acetyl esterase/lipase
MSLQSREPRTTDEVRALIDAIPMGGTPDAMRRAFELRAGPQPAAERIEVGGIEALAAGTGPVLVWFHGGGYVFGAPETHRHLAAALAVHGFRVILPRYRLAPEHPWPAALEDALAVLDALPGPVAVGGDSAGGHLALNVAGRRQVASLTLISPNTDRTDLSETRARNEARDIMVDDAGDRALARMAFGDRDPASPEVSPLLGDLSALPPTFIAAATHEVLLDDSLLLARRAALAGAAVELAVWPELFHMWTLWPQAIPEGAEALASAAAFVHRAYAARASSAG